MANPVTTLIGTAGDFAGWCLAWVQTQLGLPHQYYNAATAFDAYKAQGALTTTPSPGDLVFFGPASINGYNGHVGIVTAPGMFESVLSNGNIVNGPIAEFSSSNGAPVLGYIKSSSIGADPLRLSSFTSGSVQTEPTSSTNSGPEVGTTPVTAQTSGNTTPVIGGIGNAFSSLGSAVHNTIAAPLDFLNRLWQFLSNPLNWWRLLFFLIAALLIVLGVKLYIEGATIEQLGKEARKALS